MPDVATLVPPRLGRLRAELATFGVVGLCGYLTDVGLFNALRYLGDPGVLEHKPLSAKVISVTIATLLTYLGNRYWTWRDRPRSGHQRELSLFAFFNVVGMGIALACLAFSHYLLGLTSPLADNISANVVGLVLGTTFRFWAYRTYVFRPEPVA